MTVIEQVRNADTGYPVIDDITLSDDILVRFDTDETVHIVGSMCVAVNETPVDEPFPIASIHICGCGCRNTLLFEDDCLVDVGAGVLAHMPFADGPASVFTPNRGLINYRGGQS